MHKKRRQKNSVTASIAVCVLLAGASAPAAQPPAAVRQVQIVDESMCCAGCAQKISSQLYATRGVRDVGVDMKSRTLTVSLPEPTPEVLGQLWHAVEMGDGTPTKLVTAEATYALARPTAAAENSQPPAAKPLVITIHNLHCQGCANKIAGRLYVIKGVTKVSVDMQRSLLFVETGRNAQPSPWALIDAVSKANERTLAVAGNHGEMTIEWSAEAAPKNDHQAQQPRSGGTTR